MRRYLLATLPLLASCSPPAALPAAPASSAARPPSAAAPALPRALGAACTFERRFAQSDCGAGLWCAPMPGGYCLSFCGMSGPCAGSCAESGKSGELCLSSCQSDQDCRAAEGYVCDPTWKACTTRGALAPKAPSCAAAVLAKRRFGPAVQLSTTRSPGVYTFEPAAAIAADGTVAVAYTTVGKRGDKNALGAATLGAGGAVSADHVLDLGRENHYDPWMAADRKGKLHLVWLGFDGAFAPEKRMQIGYATSADGVSWSPTVTADDVATDCPGEKPGCLDKPMIAIGPARDDPRKEVIYVAYEVDDGMKLVRSIDGGATFSSSVPVGPGGYGDLVISADGDLHAVYTNQGEGKPPPNWYGDARNVVEYVVSHDGGKTFEKPRRVSAQGEPTPYYFSNPQVAIDARRKLLYVVYPAGTPDGHWDIMLATSRDGGASWSRIKVNDDPSCASHMTPSLAIERGSGELHVIWTEKRSAKGGIAYATCASGGATCSANEAVNDAPFAAYSLARHLPRWLGEYNTLLIDEGRKKLHVVYTATVDEGGNAVSRIFAATRTL